MFPFKARPIQNTIGAFPEPEKNSSTQKLLFPAKSWIKFVEQIALIRSCKNVSKLCCNQQVFFCRLQTEFTTMAMANTVTKLIETVAFVLNSCKLSETKSFRPIFLSTQHCASESVSHTNGETKQMQVFSAMISQPKRKTESKSIVFQRKKNFFRFVLS